MKINKKIPSFTLLEVVISMLVVAVAIAVTYTAYHIISRTYSDYIKKQDRIASFTLADRLIKRDLLEADQVVRAGEGLKLFLPAGQVIYEFKNDYLIRNQYALQADTLKIPVKNLGYFFENGPVEDGARVDQLVFQTVLEGIDISLFYKKTYSAQNLFN